MELGAPTPLDASALIKLSDQAAELSPAGWAVAYLLAGYPEASEAAVLGLPVGTRDSRLMALRQLHVGGALRAEPVCEACGTHYEMTLAPEAIGFGALPLAKAGFRAVEITGETVRVRPVTAADLLAVERIADPAAATRALAARVVEADKAVAVAALEAALEEIDPAADIWITVACPDCGTEAALAFDPVGFVAQELRQAAQRVLREVADIARVFHWSEREILALPEARRRFYLAEALA